MDSIVPVHVRTLQRVMRRPNVAGTNDGRLAWDDG